MAISRREPNAAAASTAVLSTAVTRAALTQPRARSIASGLPIASAVALCDIALIPSQPKWSLRDLNDEHREGHARRQILRLIWSVWIPPRVDTVARALAPGTQACEDGTRLKDLLLTAKAEAGSIPSAAAKT